MIDELLLYIEIVVTVALVPPYGLDQNILVIWQIYQFQTNMYLKNHIMHYTEVFLGGCFRLHDFMKWWCDMWR